MTDGDHIMDYDALIGSFLPSEIDAGVRDLVALIERQVRTAACVMRATHSAEEDFPQLPRQTGLGGYLFYLRKVSSSAGASPADRDACVELLRIAAPEGESRSIKDYRDYLAHGGIEPEGYELRGQLVDAVTRNRVAIRDYLDAITGHAASSNEKLEMGLPVLRHKGGWAVFQSIDQQVVTYHTTLPQEPILALSLNSATPDGRSVSDLAALVDAAKPNNEEKRLRESFERIERDLVGFRSAGQPILSGTYSPFSVKWERLTSEGVEVRQDWFRHSADGALQWRVGDTWASYSHFLADVSNWEIVVQRLLERMERIDAERRAVDLSDFSDGVGLTIPDSVVTRYDVLDVVGESLQSSASAKDVPLLEWVDGSARTATGVPQVFFVTGEAGVGKTYNLQQESLRRLQALRDGSHDVPLHLYVSASGLGVKSLDRIINDAVVGTRNLSFESVVALARNGMIVLVIDGFDELVGGAGYGDAFELLRPVLKGLGTHGTLLISARSSYLANQYRASLQRQAVDGSPVDHLIVELKRWSRQDVEVLFESNPTWMPFRPLVSDADLDLLGVPYFARVFDWNSKSGEEGSFGADVRTLLVESYLDRESRKLRTHGGAELVTLVDLKRIFCEAAGLMFESDLSMLDIDGFQLACAVALDVDDFSGARKALGDRLTVLCGFSALRDDSDITMFAFQHELFYEQFLGMFLVEQIDSEDFTELLRTLSRAILGRSTLEVLLDSAKELDAQVGAALAGVRRHESGVTLRSNLAALVGAMLRRGAAIPGGYINGLDFTELQLSDNNLKQEFEDCTFQRLVLPVSATSDISLRRCTVGKFEVQAKDLRRLHMSESTVSELVPYSLEGKVGTEYSTDWPSIAAVLSDWGANGIDESVLERKRLADSTSAEFARHVLTRIANRGERVYIVEANSLIPGRSASAWMPRPNDSDWGTVTRALLTSGLAARRAFSAAGVSKCKVVLQRDARDILEEESRDLSVQEFWEIVRA